MCKDDLALNNIQWLICHKTKPNHIYLICMYKDNLALNNQQGLICYKTTFKIYAKIELYFLYFPNKN